MSAPPVAADAAKMEAIAAETTPLGIVAGGGSLPLAIADIVSRRGRPVVMFALRGWAEPAVERLPHHWIAVAQFGRLFRLAHQAGCRDMVMIGSLSRPPISQMRIDWTTLRLLPRVLRAFRGGDNRLLSGVGAFFEEHGFRLFGAHEVAPEILSPAGVLGRHSPAERERADIERALALLAALGPHDVGQAVAIADGHVLAIEAAEGTDRMLERVATLRREKRVHSSTGVGVLVKAPKPGQDHRFDLPSIGPQTVERVAAAGLAGVAVLAGATIIAQADQVVRLADQRGLFVVGVTPHETTR
ncbi:MAG TPA: UDP-2,3-diacylglucosamine diphosphatase LpxI [Xanthobacteraceae bacterium]|nr:UDP-2,3-diacylglucosamine diphosphatase LpxI [Xanthobacteraceae bacterium]